MISKICERCGERFDCRINARRFCSMACANVDRRSTRERFYEKVAAPNDRGCMLWTAAVRGNPKWADRDMYGSFSLDGVTHSAHRVAWLIERGPIPDGLVVCHSCDEPLCVNIAHLFLGTYEDNTADMDRKGRRRVTVGRARRGTKLTEDQVRAIRAAVAGGATQRSQAAKYGMGDMEISRIVRRIYWRHI